MTYPSAQAILALERDRAELLTLRVTHQATLAEINKAKTLPAFQLSAASSLGTGITTLTTFLSEIPTALPNLLEPSTRTITPIIAWATTNLNTKRVAEQERDKLTEERKTILRASVDFGTGVTELRKKFERQGAPEGLAEILPALDQDFEDLSTKRVKLTNDLRDSRELHDKETNRRIELEKKNSDLLEQVKKLQKTVETAEKDRTTSEDDLHDIRTALEEIFGEDEKTWPNGESIKKAWTKHLGKDSEKEIQYQTETSRLLEQIKEHKNCPKPEDHEDLKNLQQHIQELKDKECPKPKEHKDISILQNKITEYRNTTVEAGVALQTSINKNTKLTQELENCFSLLPGVTNFEHLSSAIHGLQRTEEHATNLVGDLQATLFSWENIGLILVPNQDGIPPSIEEAYLRVTQLINAFVGSHQTQPPPQ